MRTTKDILPAVAAAVVVLLAILIVGIAFKGAQLGVNNSVTEKMVQVMECQADLNTRQQALNASHTALLLELLSRTAALEAQVAPAAVAEGPYNVEDLQ